MNILDNKLYKITDIMKLGLILNTKNKPDYIHVRNLIKKGYLIAMNKGTGDKNPRYMVLGSEIKRYKREVEGIDIK